MSRIALLLSLVVVASVPATASARSLSRSKTKAMQRALGVRADGAIGPRTRRAIRRFERRNDLHVDGRPDPELLEALGVTTGDSSRAGNGNGGTSGDEPAATDTGTATGDAAAAVDAARSAIGSPYASAGTDTSGFDCSGLTMWAFDKAGVDLPRTSYDQYEMGEDVADGAVQAGDLVFFDTAGDGASHVGIATGPDTAISATTSRGVVEHTFTDGYWADHYIGARRLS